MSELHLTANIVKFSVRSRHQDPPAQVAFHPQMRLMSTVVENTVDYATYMWTGYIATTAAEDMKRIARENAFESHAPQIEKVSFSP